MIDLDELENKRDAARHDKADLFDFYHDNWDALVAFAREMQSELGWDNT